MDSPLRTPSETQKSYAQLARINAIFHFEESFVRFLPQMLGDQKCRSLKILDVGAGDGSLGKKLQEWAARRGWDWAVTSLDANANGLALCAGKKVLGSATALPFDDNSFDAVIANQMTHHLANDTEIVAHFREAWRVARQGIIFSDIHRNAFLYSVIWLLLHAGNFDPHFRDDGLISVKKSFRVGEWKNFARQANILPAKIWMHYLARVILTAKK
ncbi:MAG: methyltransferase domain-containing protein [Verrucomicrobiota bacterium]